MKRYIPTLGGLLLTSLLSVVYAQMDAAELRCGAMGGTTAQVEHCLQQVLVDADKTLAQAHTELTQTLREVQPRFKQLKDSDLITIERALNQTQQTWQAYRKHNCDYLGELHRAIGEGSMEQLSCQLRMTKARTDELRQEIIFWREKAPAMSE